MEDRIERLEEGQKRLEEGQKKLEGDISFLRDEVRIGFNELKNTLNSMFDLTAKSIRANKKVAVIMGNTIMPQKIPCRMKSLINKKRAGRN